MRFSVTKIKAFKSCRRKYELHYIEGLTPIQTPEALETGRKYHEMIADLYEGKEPDSDDYSKEAAMVAAYKKYIMPNFKVKATEKELMLDLGNGNTMIGYADGIATDGCIVEHKTTSKDIGPDYEYQLQWDEQILAYMLMTGARKVYYTVCKKPTIRLKKNETEEDFYQRMVEWYDEDTDKKIQLMEVTRTDAEVDQFHYELDAMADEISGCNHFYKNTGECMKWGRPCEYASVCLHYDPNQDYIEFEKKEVTE